MKISVVTVLTAILLSSDVLATVASENESAEARGESNDSLVERFGGSSVLKGPARHPRPKNGGGGAGSSHDRTVATINAFSNIVSDLGAAAISGHFSRPRSLYDELALQARAPPTTSKPVRTHRSSPNRRHDRSVATINAFSNLAGTMGAAAIEGAFARRQARDFHEELAIQARAPPVSAPVAQSKPRRRTSGGQRRHYRTEAGITAFGDLAGTLGAAAIQGAFARTREFRQALLELEARSSLHSNGGLVTRAGGRRTNALKNAGFDLAAQLGPQLLMGGLTQFLNRPRSYYDDMEVNGRDIEGDDVDYFLRELSDILDIEV